MTFDQPHADFHADRHPEPSPRRRRPEPLTAATIAVAGAAAAVGALRFGLARYAAGKANPDMKRVLDALAALGAKPIEKLSVAAARSQPTPADAVAAVTGGARPDDGVTTREAMVRGAAGVLPARVYTPAGGGDEPRPLIVYWHGGGWVIADLDTYDDGARALARESGAVVVSCHYRQAPEHPFPAAHEDALAAYADVVSRAREFGADPARVAVAGESAGGNLAANIALAARGAGLARPVHQLLVYPVASANLYSASYLANARALPLSRAGMKWFIGHVFASSAQAKDPRIDLVNRTDFAGAPPATIINAEIDPLRSDGEKLADVMNAAGVAVHQATFPGVTHEFFGMDAAVAGARQAQALAGQELRRAFGDELDRRPRL